MTTAQNNNNQPFPCNRGQGSSFNLWNELIAAPPMYRVPFLTRPLAMGSFISLFISIIVSTAATPIAISAVPTMKGNQPHKSLNLTGAPEHNRIRLWISRRFSPSERSILAAAAAREPHSIPLPSLFIFSAPFSFFLFPAGYQHQEYYVSLPAPKEWVISDPNVSTGCCCFFPSWN